ncbi:MAG: diguanylate cyclase [Lachnospiraceae bacterium]|nr:diguanylate cyclase [Lachnospiraceae bacterium]
MEDKDFITSVVNNFIGGICAFRIDSIKRSIEPVFLNDGIYRMLGGGRAAVDMIFKDIRLSIIPDDMPVFEQGITDILADNGSAEMEFRIVNHDGSLMWLRLHGNLYSREGSENIAGVVILDCTEQKLIEEELKRQSDYMNLLMDTDITFDFNCRTDVCVYKIAQTDALKHDEVINGYMENIPATGIHKDDTAAFKEMLRSAMSHAHRDSIEFRSMGFFDHDDDYRWYRANIISIMGKEGYVAHVIGHIVDIHEDKMKEFELKLKADHDGLTGLLNKTATEELIRRILLNGAEQNEDGGALIILDTDNFKAVNDTYGHSEGDKVLAAIGGIISSNFKGMDVTGRIGGDEFMVYINNITPDDACRLAGKLGRAIRNAFTAEEYAGHITMSIGIATYPDHGTDFESLYEHADKALYEAKNSGKACYKLYGTF